MMLDYKRLRTMSLSCCVSLQRVDDAQFELPALMRREKGLDVFDAQRHLVDNQNQAALATALLDSLRQGRPASTSRRLFLRVRAPGGPIQPSVIGDAFDAWAARAGVALPQVGGPNVCGTPWRSWCPCLSSRRCGHERSGAVRLRSGARYHRKR